jgi:hypothetical protein
MSRTYRFKIITPNDTNLDEIFQVLSVMGIDKPKNFLSRHAITIGTNVFVPFKIGKGSQAQLRSQICTIAHEAVHVCQYKAQGAAFFLYYIFNKTKRASFEHYALTANIEMYHYLTGRILSTRQLANKLKGYGVDDDDITTAAIFLKKRSRRIRRGQYHQSQSRISAKFLNSAISKGLNV